MHPSLVFCWFGQACAKTLMPVGGRRPNCAQEVLRILLDNHADSQSPVGPARAWACRSQRPAGHDSAGGKGCLELHGAHPHRAGGSKALWRWIAALALVALLHGSSARGAMSAPFQVWLPVVMSDFSTLELHIVAAGAIMKV